MDKKPTWINLIEGRGFSGWGEVILKKEVIENTLKTRADKIFDVWWQKI